MEAALVEKITLDYSTKQILNLASVQVQATHAASLPSSAARSQFESAAQASHTVGHSIISVSTSTDEKRSHKELRAK